MTTLPECQARIWWATGQKRWIVMQDPKEGVGYYSSWSASVVVGKSGDDPWPEGLEKPHAWVEVYEGLEMK